MIRLSLAAVVALVLAGCASGSAADSSDATDKYDQSWTTPYSDTTCSDWNADMTDTQQWVAAADMLAGAWSRDGASGVPDDALVTQFQGDVTEGCSAVATVSIAEVGASIYLIGKANYGP